MADTIADEMDFHGLRIPTGIERRMLYQSSYRTIATYAMRLVDLDAELKQVISAAGFVVQKDERKNFVGPLDVVAGENLVHVHTDTAGTSGTNFCTLKLTVDL